VTEDTALAAYLHSREAAALAAYLHSCDKPYVLHGIRWHSIHSSSAFFASLVLRPTCWRALSNEAVVDVTAVAAAYVAPGAAAAALQGATVAPQGTTISCFAVVAVAGLLAAGVSVLEAVPAYTGHGIVVRSPRPRQEQQLGTAAALT